MKSQSSPTNDQNDLGQTSINCTAVQISSGDSMKMKDNVYDLTPEMHKALSSTGYTGKNMTNDNVYQKFI